MMRPVPVILCGGSGTRLWPVSTPARPKQFAALVVGRGDCSPPPRPVSPTKKHFAQPIVVAGTDHGEQAAMLTRAAGAAPAPMLLEPAGRNTAPAVVAAALEAQARDADAVIVVLPADHLIGDVEAFHRVLARAVAAARAGRIVTLGIRPDRPETGYGYILAGGAGAGNRRRLQARPVRREAGLRRARPPIWRTDDTSGMRESSSLEAAIGGGGGGAPGTGGGCCVQAGPCRRGAPGRRRPGAECRQPGREPGRVVRRGRDGGHRPGRGRFRRISAGATLAHGRPSTRLGAPAGTRPATWRRRRRS